MSNDARMIPGYRIIRELGRGGMAIVYLAEQESLGREVALKVLNPSLAADADFAERFLREARIAGSFRHRSLLPVYDAGRTGGELYLAMEYLPNGHAGDLRGADPEQIRRCLIDVAAGLAYAHAKGVVHRDIKPENILRREDGSYVLADFGIARSSQATRELTGPQAAIGTPSYMSPEQWRGEAIDGRADLYSLGIVTFELLTGTTPFRGDDGWSIGMQHMNAARPQLPGALADWQALLDRLLAVDREARFASAQELIAALGGKPEQTPSAATPRPQPAMQPTTPVPLQRSGSASRQRAIALAIAAALALSFGAYWATRDRQVPTTPATSSRDDNAAAATTAVAVPTKSVAVLPFRVLSTEASDGLFADGLSEEILASLAAIPELKVPGRTSSFAWKDKPTDARDIAKALGVAHVLEGSIRRSGTQLRITANLIGASDGATLWTQTFDRTADDVFAIQNEIAIAVSDRLAVTMDTRTLPTLARLPADQRGRYLEVIGSQHRVRSEGLGGLIDALMEFEAGGHGGADLYVKLLQHLAQQSRDRSTDFREAQRRAQRYLATLETKFPGSVEALLGKAIVKQIEADLSIRIDDYQVSLALFRQVLGRAPNDALAAAQAAFSARTLLRHKEAIAFARRAIELDPEDPSALFALAAALGSAGDGGAGMAVVEDLVRRFPDSLYANNITIWLVGEGRLADAFVADKSCDPGRAESACAIPMLVLRMLAFDRSADALDASRSGRAKRFSNGYAQLRRGELPPPDFVSTSPSAALYAMAEAWAQGKHELAIAYRDHSWAAYTGSAPDAALAARDLDARASTLFVAAAMAPGALEHAKVRSDLDATCRHAESVPPGFTPYPMAHWMLGAEILCGKLDAAFRRIEANVDGNSFFWVHWIVSPSGRDMPTAAVLRADPRFAALWQRHEAHLARERARLKELRPDLE